MKKTILAVALAMLMATPALAIDFTQTVKSFDGKDFTDETGKPVPQVLGTLIENSLLAMPGSQDEKNKNFWLAMKLHNTKGDYQPSPDEVVLMKKALGQLPTALMGQATLLIDPTFGK